MRLRFYFATAVILLSMCPLGLWGQEQSTTQEVTPAKQGTETQQQQPQPEQQQPLWFGSVNAGYRFAEVKGDKAQYDSIFDLHKGFRILDLHLSGRAPEGSHHFADAYSFTASGLGGDPYPGGQFTLRKDKLYDLRVNYRQSYYYWNANNIDSQVMSGLNLPVSLGGTPSGYTTGLAANHSWATVRRIGSVDFSLRATNQLQFRFEYDRNSRDGMSQTTRSLYYPGNPNPGWGGFATANPYLMAAPVDDRMNRIVTGFDYTLLDWTFRYRVGYQSFSQNNDWYNLVSPEQSINTSTNVFTAKPSNINAITSQELLTSAAWSESRRLRTPVSEFSYNGRINHWLELRGSYNYYHFTGPDTTSASFAGSARTSSAANVFAPYVASLNSNARVDQPNHEISQGLTATIRDWWKFHADYRYSRTTTDSFSDYDSIYNGIVATPGSDAETWRTGTHWVDINMEFIPIASLVIRPGIRYVKRDVEQFSDGVINTVKPNEALNTSTLRTKNVWPTMSIFYKPVKVFSVRGDFQSNTSTRPYTRISAHTDTGSRFLFRFQPGGKVSVEDNLIVRNSQFQDSSYRNRYRSNALNVSYNFSRQFSVMAGYSYENIFGSGAHVRSNATTPFDGFWQDAFINRGMRGAIVLRPAGRFGIDLSGNFLRTTGASRLVSTAPASALNGLPIVWPTDVGPLTFPIVTGTLFYDFQKAGRLSFDVQRAYYAEQLVSGNNFQANFLTIRWTKKIGGGGDGE